MAYNGKEQVSWEFDIFASKRKSAGLVGCLVNLYLNEKGQGSGTRTDWLQFNIRVHWIVKFNSAAPTIAKTNDFYS